MSDAVSITTGDYALYRYFDVRDRLLYIGISGDLAVRDTSHIARSRWMQLSARSAVERYRILEELREAERKAIETEHPLFNVRYNDTPEAKERMAAYLAEIGRPDLLSPGSTPRKQIAPYWPWVCARPDVEGGCYGDSGFGYCALRTDAGKHLAQAIGSADPQWWAPFAASYHELRASTRGHEPKRQGGK